ncbi:MULTISPECIES: RluA family pseudouridine synthase [unclassified Helicobacter]|uniref:RluA family pseudouridine synthase n=1 Tax=unclassified Helicobacter TaxID=2593540 RepID=UPI000CF08750|nr:MULTISPECIES: RluA family pseudouridine synthase [unclassified Helicobacter]
MPFITKTYHIQKPIKAFQLIQKILQCNNKEAQKIIDKNRIRYRGNPHPIKKSDIVLGEVEIEVFEPKVSILPFFTHKDFALYHKPSNLLTHPKGRFYHQSLCDSIKGTFGRDSNPVHRLDFETNGILLVSTHKASEVVLKKLFEENQVKKTYLALVEGIVIKNQTINLPILEPNKSSKSQDLGIKCKIHPKGKEAITHIKILKYFTNSTLLEVTPITGRTHQIRLHLFTIGHPIIGEPLYTSNKNEARKYLDTKLLTENKLWLQAKSLEFSYKGIKYFFTTPFDFF